jgi:hypothetical protein
MVVLDGVVAWTVLDGVVHGGVSPDRCPLRNAHPTLSRIVAISVGRFKA